jgi:DNA-binding LacI/PurR family transcriptional regulator
VIENPAIDAVIAVPDSTAPAVVNGIRLAGKTVGEDVRVAAYFDGRFAEWMTPTITALDFRPRDFGRRLFQLFHDVVAGDGSFATHQLRAATEVPLIVRDSTTSFATPPSREVAP